MCHGAFRRSTLSLVHLNVGAAGTLAEIELALTALRVTSVDAAAQLRDDQGRELVDLCENSIIICSRYVVADRYTITNHKTVHTRYTHWHIASGHSHGIYCQVQHINDTLLKSRSQLWHVREITVRLA